MNEPTTPQDRRAYTLAAKHALAAGLRYPECAHWSDEHSPEFIDGAGDPVVIRLLDQETDELYEEMQQLDAWMRLLAGPPPAEDASVDDHVAYLEKVEWEELRLMFKGILPPPAGGLAGGWTDWRASDSSSGPAWRREGHT